MAEYIPLAYLRLSKYNESEWNSISSLRLPGRYPLQHTHTHTHSPATCEISSGVDDMDSGRIGFMPDSL